MPAVFRSIVFVFFLALTACGRSGDTSATQDVLHRGLAGEPSTLDPAEAADNYSIQVVGDVYEGLTAESASGDVLPGVAESWSVNSTGTEYTFHLRPSARWSNGKPVRAQEFVSAWQRVVDPRHGSPVADNLRSIAGATSIIAGKAPPASLGVYASSDSTLVVKLAQAVPYLPQILTHSAAFPVYSDSSASSHSASTWVSNGPYMLTKWSPGTSVTLTKNPYYWDQPNVRIRQIEYQVVTDEQSQFSRYRAGQLDMTDIVPANAIPSLRTDRSTELVIAPFLATAYYGFNLTRPPFGTNIKLRQALAMAVDRKRLVDALAFGQTGAYSFVAPGTWNYTPQSWQWEHLDTDARVNEAKRLYAEAGYTIASPLRARLLFNSNPVIRDTAIIIAGMWKETLGVETSFNDEEYRVFLQSRHDKSRWELIRLGWTADYNDASNFLDTFREHSANNDAGYANPAFDALLDQAAQTQDPQQRRQILESSERTLLADYPVVPLYFYVSKKLIKPYVLGAKSNPLNRVGSKDLRLASH